MHGWTTLTIQLDGAAADNSACTFCLGYEDHTLGNALRWIIMKECVVYGYVRQCATDAVAVQM